MFSTILNKQEARGKANVWLAYQIGDAVGVMAGAFIDTGKRPIWRFEAFITSLHFDPLGPLGHVEVDAETGQILNLSQSIEAMIDRGRHL